MHEDVVIIRSVSRTKARAFGAVPKMEVGQGKADSQNRDAHPFFRLHLAGREGFVEMVNPAKGERLRKIFDRIDW